jgi:S-adenosylhomocysteine hydrolase
MLETALRLGMQADDILVIDKEYQYLYRHRVDGHIKHVLGAQVALYSEMGEAIIAFLEQLRSRWKRAVVLDDGGYVLPVIHRRAPHLLQFILGVVEQTASGIVALRPFEPDLRVPLFNVAESDLKQTVEARGVAAAGFRSLRAALPDVHWNGRRAIVAGYGRIGRALAHELNKESAQVAVFDTDYARLVTAQEDGFAAFDNLETVVTEWGPDVFFGATGRARFGSEIVENLQTDCVLVSMTSRDFEFDKDYLTETASHIAPVDGVGTNYTFRGEPGNCTVLLVADGFPVNFHRSESMPNEQSDLVLASMLLGAVELVRSRDRFALGFNRGVSNDIINDHDLLRIYFNLRGLPPRLS